MRVLHIHAHPDDAEIFSGGTLALLSAKGHHLTIVTMTAGDCGSHHHLPDEIAAIRKLEAARAAAMIGAEYFCAEFRDLAAASRQCYGARSRTSLLPRRQMTIIATTKPPRAWCAMRVSPHRRPTTPHAAGILR